MTPFVVLLRSINVAGHNPVAMADLRAVVARAGFSEVATYLQSGNVVCRGSGAPGAVAELLARQIAIELGVAVPVVVRTGPELATVIDGLPAHLDDPDRYPDQKTLHVTFLADEPGASEVAALRGRADQFGDDRFELVGSAVYLRCPSGYGRTKLTNAFFERALDVTATTRNWRTVTALAGMAGVAGPAGVAPG